MLVFILVVVILEKIKYIVWIWIKLRSFSLCNLCISLSYIFKVKYFVLPLVEYLERIKYLFKSFYFDSKLPRLFIRAMNKKKKWGFRFDSNFLRSNIYLRTMKKYSFHLEFSRVKQFSAFIFFHFFIFRSNLRCLIFIYLIKYKSFSFIFLSYYLLRRLMNNIHIHISAFRNTYTFHHLS